MTLQESRTPNSRAKIHVTFAFLTSVCGLCACGPVGDTTVQGDNTLFVLAREVRGAQLVQTYDLNNDGRGDVWDYFVVPETPMAGDRITEDGKMLARKELDINFDGKIDIHKSYDRVGNVLEEEMDLDFDGVMDAKNYYQQGVLTVREMDMNFDGKMDVWKHYDAGRLAIKKRDMSRDGKVDTWEYYKDGRLQRLGTDKDGDGEPETFEDIPQS